MKLFNLLSLFTAVCSVTLSNYSFSQSEKKAVGPELASAEIGSLIKAYPMAGITIQTTGIYHVTTWGCDYQVGRAQITLHA